MSSIAQKLSKAQAYKEEGNGFFKEGNFSRAKSCYGKCLAFVTGFPGSKRNQTGWEQFAPQVSGAIVASEEEESMAAELEKVVHQNLAACFLKMENPQKTIFHCDKALKLDANAWKAYLRKGEAYIMMGSLDEAKEYLQVLFSPVLLTLLISFQTALSHATEPAHEKAINREIIKLNNLLKAYKQKEKKKYRGMFSASSGATDALPTGSETTPEDSDPSNFIKEHLQKMMRDQTAIGKK